MAWREQGIGSSLRVGEENTCSPALLSEMPCEGTAGMKLCNIKRMGSLLAS